jgi:predicted acylesterase/phospholipase RssA
LCFRSFRPTIDHGRDVEGVIQIAREEAPAEECDLVMKGGITSGAVYPKAIKRISTRYRFRNLGGTSAGAIAAVAAAACEYRRNQGVTDAFDVLETVGGEISQQGFVELLFQPTPRARPAFSIGLRLTTTSGSPARRVVQAIFAILRSDRRFLISAALAVLVWAVVIGMAIWALLGDPNAVDFVAIILLAVAALPVAALLVASVALLAAVHFASQLDRALKGNWFGLCSGLTEEGYPADSALTDWLHATIQRCAGLPLAKPLTFRMLRGEDANDPLVNLQLVTTDLSAARPVILPLPDQPLRDEPTPYLFDPEELANLFPSEVVEQMVNAALEPGAQTGEQQALYTVPGLDLPIVVAARLSLSFPILLSTVPLWRADGVAAALVQHTMSDGGISSNFPIHFFDSLFPARPTFGLDLQPWRIATEEPVEMSDAARKPMFSRVKDVPTFFTQLLSATFNWRDNMQAELPGYRDRICQIRLKRSEGGLKLKMTPDVVASLVKRGDEAGVTVTDSTIFDWNRHRVTRFRTLMQMLQRGLGRPGVGRPGVYRGEQPGREAFRNVIEQWLTANSSPVDPPPLAWWPRAIQASDALVDLAANWDPAGEVDFDEDAPTPTPTLRVLPRV